MVHIWPQLCPLSPLMSFGKKINQRTGYQTTWFNFMVIDLSYLAGSDNENCNKLPNRVANLGMQLSVRSTLSGRITNSEHVDCIQKRAK